MKSEQIILLHRDKGRIFPHRGGRLQEPVYPKTDFEFPNTIFKESNVVCQIHV